MKSISIIFSMLVFAFTSILQAEEIEKHSLTVTGTVQTVVKADKASIGFTIYGYGKSLEEAFKNARNQMSAIAGDLKQIGVKESDISTTFFNNLENHEGKPLFSSKKDYLSILNVHITSTQLENLEDIIITLNKHEIERVDGINFELIDIESVKKQTLEKAIKRAQEKANITASLLGVELKEVIGFEEVYPEQKQPQYSSNNRNRYYYNQISVLARSDIFSENNESIYSEDIRFTVSVEITYSI